MNSITKTIVLDSGEKVVFSRLILSDLFSLTDELQAERKAKVKKMAAEEGFDRYETFNLLMEVDRVVPTVQEILQGCASASGSHRVLTASLKKQGAENIPDILSSLPIPECIEVARMLVLDIQEAKEKEESPFEVGPSTSPESKEEVPESKDQGPGYYGKEKK